MLRSLAYWAAAGFLLVVCGSLAAEDPTSSGPAAWVEVVPSDADAEALRPVVEDAARYRLEGLGLTASLHNSSSGVSRSGRPPAASTSFLQNASRAGAEFALECRYSGSGASMSLQLNWYEVSSGLMTAAVVRKGRVDLVLDTVILDALDELLERVRGRIEERVAAYRARVPAQSAPSGPAASGPGPSAGGQGAIAPAGTAALAGPSAPAGSAASAGSTPLGGSAATAGSAAQAGSAAAAGSAVPASPGSPTEPRPDAGSPAAGGSIPEGGAGPGALPGALPGTELPPSGRYEGARLLIAPSLAPFLALGAASYYFPIGYQSILQIDFLPAGAGARLGLGALLGVTAFQAQGTSESSLGFLIPMGLSLRYSLELGRHLGLLFHLGGGPALLLLGTDSLGALAKVLPFVRSGVGVELALGRSLGLGLEAAYEVYFESPYLIMGFAPGLCIGWRL
jgi:hypothetical protein